MVEISSTQVCLLNGWRNVGPNYEASFSLMRSQLLTRGCITFSEETMWWKRNRQLHLFMSQSEKQMIAMFQQTRARRRKLKHNKECYRDQKLDVCRGCPHGDWGDITTNRKTEATYGQWGCDCILQLQLRLRLGLDTGRYQLNIQLQ